MIIIYFLYGLFFAGLGLASYLQLRRGGEFALSKQLPWLAAFGFTYGAAGWVEMFLVSGGSEELVSVLTVSRVILQPISGLLLLIFGWGMLTQLISLPSWFIFVPGVLIVPIAFVITYAITTFITPSPIEIPIDIWSRYLLYLPGSIMAGIGFLRLWSEQRELGNKDVSNMMLGAGFAFLFEAFIVGLIVPAAPYGPASYYNYDRVVHNAFLGEYTEIQQQYGLTAWLDYQRVLEATGLPIQFWRLLSAGILTGFVVRGLDVFEAIRKRQLLALQNERDLAESMAFDAQIEARKTAESWSDLLVEINRLIVGLKDVDNILLYILENARKLLDSNYIAIALLSNTPQQLELKYQSKETSSEVVTAGIIMRNPLLNNVIVKVSPFRSVTDTDLELLENICLCDGFEAKSVAIVPVMMDTNPIGVLWTARLEDRSYSQTDLIWLECMADQVVIAIKQGLMTSKLQSMSVIEERGRIAREMHDGLAQVLGYLNLQVQTLDVLLKKNNYRELSKELRHMREAVSNAHADVRENILSLRTTLDNETGLVQGIEEYIKEFSIQTGVKSKFHNHIKGELNISSYAEVQIVCILQEALTNVRKHARAQHVHVTLDAHEDHSTDQITILIEDDGVGFRNNNSKYSFGLQTIHERAESIQGTLSVVSKINKGTTIEVTIPCLPQDQIKQDMHKPIKGIME
jgi:signal transduction histidine kinase